MRQGFTPRNLVAFLATALLASSLQAMWVLPTYAPVERLIKNVTAYIKERPKRAHGYYVLARVHSLAYAHKQSQLGVYGEGSEKGLPGIDHQFHGLGDEKERGKAPTQKELDEHLDISIRNFRRAIELRPGRATYHMGLAYVLTKAAARATTLPPGTSEETLARLGKRLASEHAATRKAARDEIRGIWREAAIAENLKAFQLSVAKDLKIKHSPMAGLDSLVSYEAGRAFVTLVKKRGASDDEKKQVDLIERAIKKLRSKPPGPVTPIIFSIDRARPLGDLLSGQQVQFDLDGDGRPEMRPWVRPSTGILVWDPFGKGKITSGRQLFGNATWWMLWRDGFQALQALDDNRDGVLRGDELKHIRVWCDTEGDGKSNADEVRSLDAYGIVGLRVRPDGAIGAHLVQSQGLILNDGRVLPLYDWIAGAPIG